MPRLCAMAVQHARAAEQAREDASPDDSYLCVSSLRRGHANLLCIVPILTDDPRRESIAAGACDYRISLFVTLCE